MRESHRLRESSKVFPVYIHISGEIKHKVSGIIYAESNNRGGVKNVRRIVTSNGSCNRAICARRGHMRDCRVSDENAWQEI